jgi:predicted permease
MNRRPWLQKYWLDLFRRSQLDGDLDEEIRAHIRLEVERRTAAGESAEQARFAALREIGGVESVKQATRDSWHWSSLERLAQDLRYGARVLRRTPVFTLVVVLSLAIGIGANTALLSLADAMFLRRLPFEDAAHLVFLEWTSGPNRLAAALSGTYSKDPVTGQQVRTSFTYLTFKTFRQQSQTLSDVFAFFPLGGVTVSAAGQAEVVPGQLVSGNYFQALRVPVVIGRSFTDDDDAHANPVAILSHRYWLRRFNGDTGIVGRQVAINGTALTVIGVTAPGFTGTQGFGSAIDISLPLGLEPQFMRTASELGHDWMWWLRIMGRLQPGASPQQVQAELQGLLTATGLEALRSEPPWIRPPSSPAPEIPQLRVQSGARGLTDSLNNMGPNGWRASQYLLPLAAISLALLLSVCLNVANLMLARASARQRELQLRQALGAGRMRLIRQLLTEAVLLSLAAAVLGAIAAYWGKDLLTAFLPQGSMVAYELRINPRVLGLTLLISVVAAMLFGVIPALRATSIAKDRSQPLRRLPGGVRPRLRQALLLVQVALSLSLVIGGGVLVRSVRNLRNVDVGFDAANILLFRVNPGSLQYDSARNATLYDEIVARTAALPGVRSVAFSDYPLVINSGNDPTIKIADRSFTVARLRVSPSFFDVLGIPIVSGRAFTAFDDTRAPLVTVVNESFARQFFAGRNPVGQRFQLRVPAGPNELRELDTEIVGIARDASIRIARDAVPPTIFVPERQLVPNFATFSVRTDGEPQRLAASVRQAVQQVDPHVPLTGLRTQSEQIAAGFTTERTIAIAAAGFATVSVVLAGMGLFGLIAYTVEIRKREFGLRLALGAQRRDVFRMAVGQTTTVVLAGMAAGVGLWLWIARGLSNMLFNVPPMDPATIIAAVALLTIPAAIASYLPARRAVKVDPVETLRCN